VNLLADIESYYGEWLQDQRFPIGYLLLSLLEKEKEKSLALEIRVNHLEKMMNSNNNIQ
jgi:hypothetical protein